MHVSALYVYPLKSARGVAVRSAEVRPEGLAHDRRWMVVGADDRVLTQREVPALARLRAEATARGLRVTVPGAAPVEAARPDASAPRAAVAVWDDVVEVRVADAAAPELAAWLGRPAHLAYQPDDALRPVDPRYGRDADVVSLADGYPLLLTTRASLEALNARLDAPVPMDRFRPNVVVDGAGAFEEDAWQTVTIGGMRFRVAKPCARCVVTTVDQATGEAGKEPLRTLAGFRTRGGKVYFGQNLVPEGGGRLAVGVAVRAGTSR